MKITIEMLEKADACERGIAQFKRKFGNSIELSRANISKHLNYIRKLGVSNGMWSYSTFLWWLMNMKMVNEYAKNRGVSCISWYIRNFRTRKAKVDFIMSCLKKG